jgi:hypothetical protein
MSSLDFAPAKKPSSSDLERIVQSLLADSHAVRQHLCSAAQRSLTMGAKLVMLRDYGTRGVLSTVYRLLAATGTSERTAKRSLALCQQMLVDLDHKATVRAKLANVPAAMGLLQALVAGDWDSPALTPAREWLERPTDMVEVLEDMHPSDRADLPLLEATSPSDAAHDPLTEQQRAARRHLVLLQQTASTVEEVYGPLDDTELADAEETLRTHLDAVRELHASRTQASRKLKTKTR